MFGRMGKRLEKSQELESLQNGCDHSEPDREVGPLQPGRQEGRHQGSLKTMAD